MHGVRFLALLMALVVVNSFVNDGSDSSSEAPLDFNLVAAAAEQTQNYPGAKFTLTAEYTSSALPEPMHAHGYGAYNSETGRSRAVVTALEPVKISVETVVDETSVYMRGGGLAAEDLPDGKEWVAFQPFLGQSFEDVMVGGGTGTPDESLQMLRAASGEITQAGQERVRGVPTKRYRATATMDDYAELVRAEGNEEMAELYEKYDALSPSPILVEASIDAKNIVRRMRMVMTLPMEDGQAPMTMDMRMDFFDFGARPEIAIPDPSRVFDATPYLEKELEEAESD